MDQKRIFLACQISEGAKAEVFHICQHLKDIKFALKFTPKEKLHITLAFLPRVEIEKLNHISEVVKNVCQGFSEFSLFLNSLGAFPNLKLPKVVYVTLSGETAVLSALAKKIQHQLEIAEFTFDHERFVPHITIARIKNFVNKVERKKLGETIQRWGKLKPVKIPVAAVNIFESTPTSAGHVHTLLEKIPLKDEKA